MRWSASQPPTEKSPSEPPVPRKLNVKTIQPMSRAMRSASSGNVRPDASEPRGGVGKSWQRTTAGTARVVAGRAKCDREREPVDLDPFLHCDSFGSAPLSWAG